VVVDDLQAGHGVRLGLGAFLVRVDIGVALDVGEPRRVGLRVVDVRGPVPRLDVGLGGDGSPVVELPVLLELDGPRFESVVSTDSALIISSLPAGS
jgi:hypothetical protein